MPHSVLYSKALFPLHAKVLCELAQQGKTICAIVPDLASAKQFEQNAGFFTPTVSVWTWPEWDCHFYERLSPSADIASKRFLLRLRLSSPSEKGQIILFTPSSLLQKGVPFELIKGHAKILKQGSTIDFKALPQTLIRMGYERTSTVTSPAQFSIRGGIMDIVPAGETIGFRFDCFGNTIEDIRLFDIETQISESRVKACRILPASEVILTPETQKTFLGSYEGLFGAWQGKNDPLFTAIKTGKRTQGIEQSLPLFYETALVPVWTDWPENAVVAWCGIEGFTALNPLYDEIEKSYLVRKGLFEEDQNDNKTGFSTYAPTPVELMFSTGNDVQTALQNYETVRLTPYDIDPLTGSEGDIILDSVSLPPLVSPTGESRLRVLIQHLQDNIKFRRCLIAVNSKNSGERLKTMLSEAGFKDFVCSWDDKTPSPPPHNKVLLTLWPLKSGYITVSDMVWSEEDIFGEKLPSGVRKPRKSIETVLAEATTLAIDDLIVHKDHGIGRYKGLKTVTVTNIPHDCLVLEYADGDLLYLPVENMDLMSRYGSEDSGTVDKLGASSWQSRKARLKKRIRDIADSLMKTAAERLSRKGLVIEKPLGSYEEFCAGFPYEPTEDQLEATQDVLDDLASGRPMDRLVCGDVGFGKTEIAMRAAYIAAMSGIQVALIVPTTLLARQHASNFIKRFEGTPLRIAQLSRMVSTATQKQVKEDLARGTVDIVIGTHALLAKTVVFKNLGLVIVDEEQRFGVTHKEHLKNMKANVHVLTLTATPIPRTLQFSMNGVRDLSLMTTPPVDRLSIRTAVMTFDPVTARDALLRESARGGQSYIIAPRITHIQEVEEFLAKYVPELKYGVAHGQMPSTKLENVMTGFYEGTFDILVATAIIESGIDVPRANTMIVYSADHFGLTQLYQIRGRIGRAKHRAYAYLTTPPYPTLTAPAEKRLKILGTLDTLGAGFTVASHDMDLRGAGNLLGEEQSGHMREVGFELYQEMLNEAMALVKSGTGVETVDDLESSHWTPHLDLDMPVLIPESYIPDLDIRLNIYRRLSKMETRDELEAFKSEMNDRFGALPQEVQDFTDLMDMKQTCRRLDIARIEAGKKGIVIAFRDNPHWDIMKLTSWISKQKGMVSFRKDGSLFYQQMLETPEERLSVAKHFVSELQTALG